MPYIGHELDLPLALTTNHPLQIRVAGSRLAVHPSILQLRKVALEEADLVLVRRARYIGCRAFDREMVVDLPLVDGGSRLGNKLCAPHVRVPFCGAVDSDLGALLASGVCGVLVAGREVDIFGDIAGAMDVVLVRADLVCP